MFCPNCGNNCGDAKFCSNCGARLPQKVENQQTGFQAQPQGKVLTAWTVGMPCPFCGGTKLEGNHCAFCGAQLKEDAALIHEEEQVYDIPYGRYKAILDALTLRDSDFTVETRVGFRRYTTVIPYNQVKAVQFVHDPYRSMGSLGYVMFRWEGNKDVPFPVEKRAGDKTTICHTASGSTNSELLFYHLFYVVKALSNKGAEFSIEGFVSVDDVDDVISTADMDRLFRKYAPFREEAVDDLCIRTGLRKVEAKHVIDRSFDARQKEIYDADPRSAIKDLNLLLEREQQKKEEAARKQEEEEKMRRMAKEVANQMRNN